MTTNLHDKMLAAIDAYFSASDAVEEEAAENLLLDVRDEIRNQPAQQEPVAYAVYHRMGGSKSLHWSEQHSPDGDANEYQLLPLYTSPQAQPALPAQQEPVAWGNLANWCLDSDRVLITDKDDAAKYHRNVYDLTPLYTTPQAQPAREPLTDEKYEAIVEDLADWSRYVEVDTAHQTLERHVRQVLIAHSITKGNT